MAKKGKASQEGHLEEGKAARPTKGMKSDKPSQNGKEELRYLKNTKNSKTPLESNSP
jgi:hypothetical protein